MIVCDRCRSLEAQASQVSIIFSKTEEKANAKKPVEREMKRFHIHLCEKCITATFTVIGKSVKDLHSSVNDQP